MNEVKSKIELSDDKKPDVDNFPAELEIEFLPFADNFSKEDQKQHEGEGFDTHEHIALGNEGFSKFLKTLEHDDPRGDFLNLLPLIENDDNTYTLDLSAQTNTLTLSPGEIVALGGDYFGDPDKPISFAEGANEETRKTNREARFEVAFSTLLDPKHYEQIQKILNYDREQTALMNPSPNMKLQKQPDGIVTGTLKYSWMTSDSILPGDFCHNRYWALAVNNFDHFGEDAINAFEAGLSKAIAQAKLARSMKSDAEKKFHLGRAIAYVLYACHFLTDLYASGHINTPRRQLLNAITGKGLEDTPDLKNISSTKKMLAGLLAKKMHDENNKKGVWVKNQHNQSWQAFGDGMHHDSNNKENANKATEAVSLALQDVFLTYTGNPKSKPLFINTFKNIIPQADEQKNMATSPPLFKIAQDKSAIEVREKEGYKPMPTNMASMCARYFKIKVKNAAQTVTELNEQSQEALLEQFEKMDCRMM